VYWIEITSLLAVLASCAAYMIAHPYNEEECTDEE